MIARPPMRETLLRLVKAMAAERSPCPGGHTGCAIVSQDWRVLALGYNGPPHGWPDNLIRCTRDELDLHGGVGYEVCPCVHAEANALAHAARHGVATEGAVALCTRQPCCACAKSLLQAGIERVAFYDAGGKIIDIQTADIISSRIEQARQEFGAEEAL